MSEPTQPGSYVSSYDDVSKFALDDEREQALHAAQTECTFMWSTKDGDPVGVIMNYLLHDGSFWVTCTRRRKRVAAVEARPVWRSPSRAAAPTSASAKP